MGWLTCMGCCRRTLAGGIPAPSQLVFRGAYAAPLDPVTLARAHWLARHIGDVELVLWVAGRGGQLHPRFAQAIVSALCEPPATAAACDVRLRTLWHPILAGRLDIAIPNTDLHGWHELLLSEGLSVGVWSQLRAMLMPCVALGSTLCRPLGLEAAGHYPDRSADMRALVDTAVHLRARHVFGALDRPGEELRWTAAIPRSTR